MITCKHCGVGEVVEHKAEMETITYCLFCSQETRVALERPRPLKPIDRAPQPAAWRQDIIKREGTGKKGGKKRSVFDD